MITVLSSRAPHGFQALAWPRSTPSASQLQMPESDVAVPAPTDWAPGPRFLPSVMVGPVVQQRAVWPVRIRTCPVSSPSCWPQQRNAQVRSWGPPHRGARVSHDVGRRWRRWPRRRGTRAVGTDTGVGMSGRRCRWGWPGDGVAATTCLSESLTVDRRVLGRPSDLALALAAERPGASANT